MRENTTSGDTVRIQSEEPKCLQNPSSMGLTIQKKKQHVLPLVMQCEMENLYDLVSVLDVEMENAALRGITQTIARNLKSSGSVPRATEYLMGRRDKGLSDMNKPTKRQEIEMRSTAIKAMGESDEFLLLAVKDGREVSEVAFISEENIVELLSSFLHQYPTTAEAIALRTTERYLEDRKD